MTKQTDPNEQGMVDLIAFLSSEFGSPPDAVRRRIAEGRIVLIEEGGKETVLSGKDRFELPYEKLLDKTIWVQSDGPGQSYSVKYTG